MILVLTYRQVRGTPPLYAGRETLKRLVPLPMYEKMRRLLFSLSKSD